MKKKLLICTIVIFIVFSLLLAACNMSNSSTEENKEAINDNVNEPDTNILTNNEIIDNDYDDDFKIVILTLTANYSEEEYYAAEKAVEMYGSEKIIHESTQGNYYPEQFDNFCANLLEDQDVKVLITNPGLEYFEGMFEKIRSKLPNLLIITTPPYNVDNISEYADVVIDINEEAICRTIPGYAKELGAKTLVFYSFPRQMEIPYLAKHRDFMEDACIKNDVEYVYTEIIDPIVDRVGAEQFVKLDVSRKVEEFGKETCFYLDYPNIAKPLVRCALEREIIVVPSSYFNPDYDLIETLGIEFYGESFWDPKWLNQQIAGKLAEHGASGRFFAWPVSASLLIGTATVEYALAYCEGLVGRQADKDMMVKCLEHAMKDFGYEDHGLHVNLMEGTDNYFLFTEDYITY